MTALARQSFFFVAATASGGRTMGVREARDPRALADTLRRERLLLLRSYKLPAWAVREQGLPLKDRAAFNDQLAQLLHRGVPLVEALEVTASAVSPHARTLVERMREAVAAGAGFADACAKTGVFDRVTIAVYRAAERTGDLAGSTRQLAMNAKRQLKVVRKVATLLLYPAVVLVFGTGVTLLMLMAVVPRIADALAQLNLTLPWYTQVLVGIGRFMQTYWLFLLVGALAGLTAAVIARKPLLAAAMRLARRTPFLRDVLLASESARFFSVMAAMTRSGVTLGDSLSVGVEAVGMPVLRRELGTLRARLVEGGILRNLIESVTALPLATRRLLIAGERAGDMEAVFDALAEDMTDEVDRRAERFLHFLEPMLIVLLFLAIGGMMVSIMVPLITLTQQAI
ncbi:MAG: type II secretion system F family protein [Phycisphaerales bacterium]|nr:type II secretion system F family protein [Phycisphaerales bacterium]